MGVCIDFITFLVSGHWGRSLEYLAEMQQLGVAPNTVTYNTLISACARGGQIAWSRQMFKRMEKAQVPRDTVTYSAFAFALEKSGEYTEAIKVLDQMKGMCVPHNAVTLRLRIRMCADNEQWDQCWKTFSQVRQCNLFRRPMFSEHR